MCRALFLLAMTAVMGLLMLPFVEMLRNAALAIH
jgi:hypothetical protein